jgi:hypothetical protein
MRTGALGYTVRITTPSRSSARRFLVNIFWQMPSMVCSRSVNRTGSPSAIAPMIRIVHRSPMRSSTPRLRHNHHQPTRSLLQVLVGHSYATPAILADRQSASSCGTNQRLRSPVN